MDVGNPSNFERMKDLFQEDVTKFREIISGYYFIDEETKATVQEVYKESGYLLDSWCRCLSWISTIPKRTTARF